jgi:hypothetical protein
MKGMTCVAFAAALAATMTACESYPAEPFSAQSLATARLAGDFQAQTAVFTSPFDPALQFDVISQDGQLQFGLHGDGRFTSALAVPGRPVLTRTGGVVIAGDRLIFTDDGGIGSRTVPFTFDGRELRFVDPGLAFDFNGAGTLQPAVLDVVLVRQASARF